jgi:hypothetical protein
MTDQTSCPLAHSDAAYVLGALSPAERLEFERHLPTCASCRRSVAQLAGMPGLLARVPEEWVEEPVVTEPVPPTVLPALVARVRREQRRKTVLLSLGAAAAVAAVALGAAAFQATRDDERLPDAVPPSSAAPSVAPFQDMDVVINYGMTAKVSLTPGAEGTSLLVNCDYPESQDGHGRKYEYDLVLVTRDGVVHPTMQWRAGPGDKKRGIPGWSEVSLGDIARVEVLGESGDTILKLKL